MEQHVSQLQKLYALTDTDRKEILVLHKRVSSALPDILSTEEAVSLQRMQFALADTTLMEQNAPSLFL